MAALGATVHYVLTGDDADDINRRRNDFAAFNTAHRDTAAGAGEFPGRSGHVGHHGNGVREGDVCAATVVRDWGDALVNLKVHLDGNDDYWATSKAEGDGPGFWQAPA